MVLMMSIWFKKHILVYFQLKISRKFDKMNYFDVHFFFLHRLRYLWKWGDVSSSECWFCFRWIQMSLASCSCAWSLVIYSYLRDDRLLLLQKHVITWFRSRWKYQNNSIIILTFFKTNKTGYSQSHNYIFPSSTPTAAKQSSMLGSYHSIT